MPKAYELIADFESFCIGANARESDGDEYNACLSTSDAACRWNAQGAISRCYDTPAERARAHVALSEYAKTQGFQTTAEWNDQTPHEKVVEALMELGI